MGVSTIFSGNSRFANDFQAIINRSVAIASLPLTQMNTVKSTLTAQAAALDELEAKFPRGARQLCRPGVFCRLSLRRIDSPGHPG